MATKKQAIGAVERQLRDQVRAAVARILDGQTSREGPPFAGVEDMLGELVVWVRREAAAKP